jgi:DNA-binding response OmpR family regulator
MEPVKILIIEDDYIVARTIERSLQNEHFEISLANSGDKGLRMARQDPPDLVILDIIMPHMDGYSVCQHMRADPMLEKVPILFLTAKVKVRDRITGLIAGADDYICKPFNVDELILRVQAILRRTMSDKPELNNEKYICPSNCLVVGDFILNTSTFELHTPVRGKIRLTPLQFDLLYHLMTHPGIPFTPSRLLDEVWDYPSGKGSPDLVRVHIKTLRDRIENNPRTPTFICTIPGRGYSVQPAS